MEEVNGSLECPQRITGCRGGRSGCQKSMNGERVDWLAGVVKEVCEWEMLDVRGVVAAW